MYLQSNLLLGLLASISTANAAIPCGNGPPSLEVRSLAAINPMKRLKIREEREHVSVDTYVHVIADSEKLEDGYISEDIVKREIDHLNSAFAAHDFSFDLIKTARIVNASWTSPDGNPGAESNETDMRVALRQGGYADLNLFFTPGLVPGGRCELPEPNPTSDIITNDGCLVKAQNEDLTNPQYQNTIIHEVGHWLGLEHTFENGCDEPGDYVDDTPFEAGGRDMDKCPDRESNSCPDKPGFDPVDNYMTYTKFGCFDMKFTPGQAERMHGQWHDLRSSFIKAT